MSARRSLAEFFDRSPSRHRARATYHDAHVPMAMTMRRTRTDLEWRMTEVDGRRASFAVGGRGLPVVFLHGWGLGHRAYQSVLGELVARGCRVYAPAMPGFSGTADLPVEQRTIDGYAAWVQRFLDTVGVDEPALVIGHSFGGGVAICLGHDAPAYVRHLVLINSVGSPAGSGGPALVARGRPPWEIGLQLVKEYWSRETYRVMQAMSEDLFRNMIANPWALIEVGALARGADLRAELTELRRRETPILVLWSDGDGVLPRVSFDALCAAIGTDGRVVTGGHSWLLANPRAFSEVLDNVVQVQVVDREITGVRSTTAELRRLLRQTKIPARVVTRLLTAVSPLWTMSEQPSVLATDLALCHPPLAPGELRAVARPMDGPTTYRLTVVSADRAGLLADTASAVASAGLTVLTASAATWTDLDIALHSMTVATTTTDDVDWDALGRSLRDRSVEPAARRYVPTGRAAVTMAEGGPGRTVVKVTARDGLGLLESITRWFADHGVSIEAAEITTHEGRATDRFLVDGEFDPAALATHLSRRKRSRWRGLALPRCRCIASPTT
jgi:pimeloyl-ACP methyl ester carboxylesterase/predicted amino acid-binding ACT domain protein